MVTANDPIGLAAGIDLAPTQAVGPLVGGRATGAAHDHRSAVADWVGRLQELVAG